MAERTEVIAVQLANGTVIHAQATALGGEEDIAHTTLAFAGVEKVIEGIAQEISHTLERVKPRKASVEFGLELALESGQLTALLVKGAGTASLRITLEWHEPPHSN